MILILVFVIITHLWDVNLPCCKNDIMSLYYLY